MEDVLFDKNFMILNKKYYLVDARYHNTDYLLYPYHGVRYHLKNQAIASQKPINKEELFNFYYSSQQNMVERIFNITNYYYQILNILLEFSIVV